MHVCACMSVYTEANPTESDPWPRAVLYDIECNSMAKADNGPLSIVEFPGFTYTGERER